MLVERSIVFKSLADAEPGELLILEMDGEKGVGILINKEHSYRIAVLKGGDAPWPHLRTIQHSERCGSLGKDWLLELLDGPESFPYNAKTFVGHYGLVCLNTGDIPVLRLGPASSANAVNEINLNDCSRWAIDENSIPYLKWQVWRSKEHFDAKDAERGLIVTIEAQEPAPR